MPVSQIYGLEKTVFSPWFGMTSGDSKLMPSELAVLPWPLRDALGKAS